MLGVIGNGGNLKILLMDVLQTCTHAVHTQIYTHAVHTQKCTHAVHTQICTHAVHTQIARLNCPARSARLRWQCALPDYIFWCISIWLNIFVQALAHAWNDNKYPLSEHLSDEYLLQYDQLQLDWVKHFLYNWAVGYGHCGQAVAATKPFSPTMDPTSQLIICRCAMLSTDFTCKL